MRVGFLFNHRSDQVWHAAPLAFELSRRHPDTEVVCITANAEVESTLDRLAALYPGHRCRVERAHVPLPARLAHAALSTWLPVEKWQILRGNRPLYARLDALVVPDITSLKVRTHHQLDHLKMILTRHGAGDRAGSFPAAVAGFDLVLVPGPKTESELLRRGRVSATQYAVTGYTKFAAVDHLPQPRPPFANDKPVVLYNPHFEPGLSSWQPWGLPILEFFRRNPDRYNLIFAPHLKLFARRGRYRARLPQRYRNCPNIHVDLGSEASSDMTYTRAADLYLGDVSSQVYEFLRWPRPCLFLNPHGIHWQDDPHFRHWHLGPVLGAHDALDAGLAQAFREHPDYAALQRRAVAETFDMAKPPADVRGADAVHRFLARESSVSSPHDGPHLTPGSSTQ